MVVAASVVVVGVVAGAAVDVGLNVVLPLKLLVAGDEVVEVTVFVFAFVFVDGDDADTDVLFGTAGLLLLLPVVGGNVLIDTSDNLLPMVELPAAGLSTKCGGAKVDEIEADTDTDTDDSRVGCSLVLVPVLPVVVVGGD